MSQTKTRTLDLKPGLVSVVDGVSANFLCDVDPTFISGSLSDTVAGPGVARRGRSCLLNVGRDIL